MNSLADCNKRFFSSQYSFSNVHNKLVEFSIVDEFVETNPSEVRGGADWVIAILVKLRGLFIDEIIDAAVVNNQLGFGVAMQKSFAETRKAVDILFVAQQNWADDNISVDFLGERFDSVADFDFLIIGAHFLPNFIKSLLGIVHREIFGDLQCLIQGDMGSAFDFSFELGASVKVWD